DAEEPDDPVTVAHRDDARAGGVDRRNGLGHPQPGDDHRSVKAEPPPELQVTEGVQVRGGVNWETVSHRGRFRADGHYLVAERLEPTDVPLVPDGDIDEPVG